MPNSCSAKAICCSWTRPLEGYNVSKRSMSSKAIIPVGSTFNYLTVIAYAGSVGEKSAFLCRCVCGRETTVLGKHLKSGNTKSCGCRRKKGSHTTHGMKRTRLYNIWCGMKQRCYYKKSISYPSHGKRGIRVCGRWLHSFDNFYKDMHESHEKHLAIHGKPQTTLDRIDNSGSYSQYCLRPDRYNSTSCRFLSGGP